MIIYRTKLNGLIAEFAFLEGLMPTQAVILCDGLPSAPYRKETIESLAKQGFLVFYPHYRGTWESEGEFLLKSPVEDVKLVVESIKSGHIQELFADRIFDFQIDKIYLIGVSFGGSVVLSASSLQGINKVISFCPVVNFRTFGTKYPEQDLRHMGDFMKVAFTNGYRFDSTNWNKLLEGSILDPVGSVEKTDPKNIIIVQCEDDTTVNYHPVVEFAEKFGIQCKLLPTGGHFSFSKIPKDLWMEIFAWLSE